MQAKTQPAPGYYLWEIPGKPIAIHLRLDVVDRLLAEVMLTRAAEVRGLLIGTIEHGEPSVVRVDDFERVESPRRRGSSYLFAEDELASFEDASRRWQPEEALPTYAVGYFRSQTSDGFSLTASDRELLDRFFPSPWHIALLIKPSTARVSSAGFFFREEGGFQKATPLEFPFRRRELASEETRPQPPAASPPGAAVADEEDDPEAAPMQPPQPVYTRAPSSRSRMRGGWMWMPLSFIFLLLGVLLGFQAALTMAPRVLDGGAQDFALGLAVSKVEDNLSVKWNPQAPAVRAAQRGVLEIEDGSYTKSVDLDTPQLQNGNIVYRNSSNMVTFRLMVYPRGRTSVNETTEWRE